MNESNSMIHEISAFSVSGTKILSRRGNSNFMNKFSINGATGYYIVRVVLDNAVYNEKVFLNK